MYFLISNCYFGSVIEYFSLFLFPRPIFHYSYRTSSGGPKSMGLVSFRGTAIMGICRDRRRLPGAPCESTPLATESRPNPPPPKLSPPSYSSSTSSSSSRYWYTSTDPLSSASSSANTRTLDSKKLSSSATVCLMSFRLLLLPPPPPIPPSPPPSPLAVALQQTCLVNDPCKV